MRRLLALGLLTVALALQSVAAPAFACDCGGLVPPPDAKAMITSERAILSLNEGVQVTDLLLDLDSTAMEAGIIIPTPTPATVTNGSLDTFEDVERAMLPRPVYVEDWWGLHAIVAASRDAVTTVPRVLDRVELGPVEATTIAAGDPAGMATWLTANGYVLPEGAAALFAPYVKDGWSFVAIKLASDRLLDGTLDPIRLTFATEQLVYPARLLSGYSEPRKLRLYVIEDHRAELVRADAAGGPINAAQKTVWAGELLPGDIQRGRFLTVFDIRYDEPETQATADIGIVAAETDEEVVKTVTVVRTMSLMGVPFGTALVGGGVLALLVLTAVFIFRMRIR